MPWDPNYSTQLAEIDAQHRFFISLLDMLEVATSLKNLEHCRLLLREVERYTLYHFRSEEELMRAYDYPLEEHQAEHERILQALRSMIADPTVRPAKIRMFLYKWLTNHIQLDDAEAAKHILARRRQLIAATPVSSDDALDCAPQSQLLYPRIPETI